MTNFLMNRQNRYVNNKYNGKNCNNKQSNALLDIVKDKKYDVWATFLVDFTKFLLLYFGILVDLQYDKSKAHTSRFPDIVEETQAGFKNPKSYGHCMKAVNILSLISKVTKLATHLEKKLCHHLTQNLSKI